jgi:hypothetical protein
MQLPFFSVSVRKLAVMYVATLGLYLSYWYYQQWVAVRNFNRLYISPAARTVVAPVFTFGLVKRILDASGFAPVASFGLSALLGTFLLVTTLAGQLPSPYMPIAALALFPTLALQRFANRANQVVDPDHHINAKFSRLNWIAIAISGALLLLIVAGLVFALVRT